MHKVYLPISACSEVNKVVRLRCAIRARKNGLLKQFKDIGRPLSLAVPLDIELDHLDSLYNRLVDSSVIPHTYRQVRKEFLMLPANIKLHSIRVFGSFKKFKYDPEMRLNHLKGKYKHANLNGASMSLLGGLKAAIQREQNNIRLMDRFIQQSKQGVIYGRKSEVLSRLLLESCRRASEGWFFVFNTLTITPECMSQVFSESDIQGLTSWLSYIRSTDRLFGQAAFVSYRNALAQRSAGNDFHLYFGVVEKGGETGRLHLHVLHMFKSLPSICSDPNTGCTVPNRRSIDALKQYWKHGFSDPIAVRFGACDSYARLGWRWPVEKDKESKQWVPIQAKPVEAICSYVSKYLTKSLEDKTEVVLWRSRISRRMGQQTLTEKISQMPLKTRLSILKNPRLKLEQNQVQIPRRLSRRLLMKSLPESLMEGISSRAWQSPPNNMFARVNRLIRGQGISIDPKRGNIVISNLSATAASSHFDKSTWSMPISGVSYATT